MSNVIIIGKPPVLLGRLPELDSSRIYRIPEPLIIVSVHRGSIPETVQNEETSSTEQLGLP